MRLEFDGETLSPDLLVRDLETPLEDMDNLDMFLES